MSKSADELAGSQSANSNYVVSKHATEEVMMVKERRCTVESLGWEAKEWEKRAAFRSEQGEVLDPGLQEGLQAYAHDQADLRTSLQKHFHLMWQAPLAENAPSITITSDSGQDVIDDDDDKSDDGEGDIEGTYDYEIEDQFLLANTRDGLCSLLVSYHIRTL